MRGALLGERGGTAASWKMMVTALRQGGSSGLSVPNPSSCCDKDCTNGVCVSWQRFGVGPQVCVLCPV